MLVTVVMAVFVLVIQGILNRVPVIVINMNLLIIVVVEIMLHHHVLVINITLISIVELIACVNLIRVLYVFVIDYDLFWSLNKYTWNLFPNNFLSF